ncbi:MAG: SUMF1/EgtB/PvdO family nonheme iron enzyme, partial [Candidatus Eremiobacteraeota bacterium]|nr:SUMF1/EgtB/PvdO family nonheme iron enzyme [Candidatus Eremiobacteraeota bacterium]
MDWYHRNRERTASIFAMIADEAFYDRPIPLRHPFAFYEGHVPAFSFFTLNERSLGEAPVDPQLERLFERGIDPGTIEEAKAHDRADWPDRASVASFAARCDERVLDALASGRIEDPKNPRLVRGQAAYAILEHEAMHQETLCYIIHQLAHGRKHGIAQRHEDHAISSNPLLGVAAGSATLGAAPDEIPFGWDNEFGRTEVAVSAFEVNAYPVTNGAWLRFVADGGPVPEFWQQRDGAWHLRLLFEDIPLPLSWPVYVSHRQAAAYARWAGMRLPSEPEYHRAAFGTPEGAERPFPWGNEAPAARHGNFGFERFDPEPVDSHPAGISAWGVADLVGNGWEWTST